MTFSFRVSVQKKLNNRRFGVKSATPSLLLPEALPLPSTLLSCGVGNDAT